MNYKKRPMYIEDFGLDKIYENKKRSRRFIIVFLFTLVMIISFLVLTKTASAITEADLYAISTDWSDNQSTTYPYFVIFRNWYDSLGSIDDNDIVLLYSDEPFLLIEPADRLGLAGSTTNSNVYYSSSGYVYTYSENGVSEGTKQTMYNGGIMINERKDTWNISNILLSNHDIYTDSIYSNAWVPYSPNELIFSSNYVEPGNTYEIDLPEEEFLKDFTFTIPNEENIELTDFVLDIDSDWFEDFEFSVFINYPSNELTYDESFNSSNNTPADCTLTTTGSSQQIVCDDLEKYNSEWWNEDWETITISIDFQQATDDNIFTDNVDFTFNYLSDNEITNFSHTITFVEEDLTHSYDICKDNYFYHALLPLDWSDTDYYFSIVGKNVKYAVVSDYGQSLQAENGYDYSDFNLSIPGGFYNPLKFADYEQGQFIIFRETDCSSDFVSRIIYNGSKYHVISSMYNGDTPEINVPPIINSSGSQSINIGHFEDLEDNMELFFQRIKDFLVMDQDKINEYKNLMSGVFGALPPFLRTLIFVGMAVGFIIVIGKMFL